MPDLLSDVMPGIAMSASLNGSYVRTAAPRGRELTFQAECRQFESVFPLHPATHHEHQNAGIPCAGIVHSRSLNRLSSQ